MLSMAWNSQNPTTSFVGSILNYASELCFGFPNPKKLERFILNFAGYTSASNPAVYAELGATHYTSILRDM